MTVQHWGQSSLGYVRRVSSILNPDPKANPPGEARAQSFSHFTSVIEANVNNMEGDHSIKTVQSKGAAISQASGGKIPYPKHVWSPAGGWYAQPANWKANTAIMGLVVFGLTAIAFNIGAEREFRHKMPEKGRFFPSRYWSRQIIEHERAEAAKEAAAKSQQ